MAIEFSQDLIEEAKEHVLKIQHGHPDFHFIPAQNWHLTLHFFGPLSQESIALLKDPISSACSQLSPFSLSISGLGVFPASRRADLIWLGISGDLDRLQRLKMTLDETLKKMNFAVEERPFHPHVTVARSKKACEIDLRYNLRSTKTCIIDRVVLFKSILLAGGARYEVLYSFPLIASATTY